jgi:hypothetical protein
MSRTVSRALKASVATMALVLLLVLKVTIVLTQKVQFLAQKAPIICKKDVKSWKIVCLVRQVSYAIELVLLTLQSTIVHRGNIAYLESLIHLIVLLELSVGTTMVKM